MNSSITRRWVRGSLLITILVLVAAETVFLYFTVTMNYDSVRRALESRVSTIITQLSVGDTQTEEGRGVLLRRMLEQFSEKDKFELMLVNSAGRVAVSTTGAAPVQTETPADLVAALQSEDGMGSAVYRTPMGEKVMAVTSLLPFAAEDLIAVRIVTSLTLVDDNIGTITAASMAIVMVVILVSIRSGLFFIRSIVLPIGEIEETAARMAKGNLDIRITNKYNDEIGKLADTINHMAGELDKSERMKNEFISSVSHELRTPLTSIKGWIETIGRVNDPSDPSFHRGVQIIANETDRLYAMVEELLDFSRMQSGLKLEREVLDLVAEVSDAAIMAQPRVTGEGIRLEYTEPELPMPVYADPRRLRQVFVNILDNAVKYSDAGSTIFIEILSDGVNAYVNITDEGQGIAPEDLENVKVKFYKGRGAVRGSGIGLAVVDEIVTAHGGGVEIQSELGHGTTVTVRLPLYKKGEKTPEPEKGTESNV